MKNPHSYVIYLLVILEIDITGNYLFDSLNYKINYVNFEKITAVIKILNNFSFITKKEATKIYRDENKSI